MRENSRSVAIACLTCFALAMFAPANARSCNSGPYLIFFDLDSATLDAEDRERLDIVIRVAGELCFYNSQISIAGHTDRNGSQSYNQILSDRRNKAVAKYFISKQVSDDRLVLKVCSAKVNRSFLRAMALKKEKTVELKSLLALRVKIFLGKSDDNVMFDSSMGIGFIKL